MPASSSKRDLAPRPSGRSPTPLQLAQGITLLALLVVSAFAGTVVLAVSMIVLPFSRSIFRRVCDTVAGAWFRVPCFCLEVLCGTKIVMVTDDGRLPNRSESSVLISNHRTRLDWFFLWSFCLRADSLSRLKIILKDDLKRIPLFGWCMQLFRFLFLKRNWDEDSAHMTRLLTSFGQTLGVCQPMVLIFPEGTDLSIDNVDRAHAFADKAGLAKYEHVLHPRTKGFVLTVQTLRKVGAMQAIYDVTMGFPDEIPETESMLATGRLSKEIHMRVRRFDNESLPKDDEGLAQWCKDRFAHKEAELRQFAATGKFLGRPVQESELAVYLRSLFLTVVTTAWVCLSIYLVTNLPHNRDAALVTFFSMVFMITLCQFGPGAENLELWLLERDATRMIGPKIPESTVPSPYLQVPQKEVPYDPKTGLDIVPDKDDNASDVTVQAGGGAGGATAPNTAKGGATAPNTANGGATAPNTANGGAKAKKKKSKKDD